MSNEYNEKNKEILDDIKERFRIAAESEHDWRAEASDDLKFCDPKTQWDEDVKLDRQADGRPIYSVDKIGPIIRLQTNSFRQNRPGIRVSGTDTRADEETANVIMGLIKHIEYRSGVNMSYVTAYENALRVGKGYLRLSANYEDEMSMDQELQITAIENPFSVYYDPHYISPDGEDAEWCIIATDIPEKQFQKDYPGAEVVSCGYTNDIDGNSKYSDTPEKMIRILEDFKKVRVPIKLYKLDDESIVTEVPEGARVIQERESYKTHVRVIKTQGTEILEENVWECSMLPIIPVFGDVLNMKGKRDYRGIIRAIKDNQKMINIQKSNTAELIASMPKAPWIGPKGFPGNKGYLWADSNTRNIPYLEYETTDPETGAPLPPPTRNTVLPPIQAMAAFSQMVEGDLKSSSVSYDPVMGKNESNQSGVAIQALQTQGQLSTFGYTDNMSRALRLVGKQILNLLSVYYDVPRVIRIIGLDGADTMTPINMQHEVNGITKMFDLTTGKYDVIIETGPGTETKRALNKAILVEAMRWMPQLSQVCPDKLVMELLDSPSAIEIASRLKKTIPQQLLDPAEIEKDPNDPSNMPIPPQIKQQLEQMGALIQAQTQELNDHAKATEIKQYEIESKERVELLKSETAIAIKSMELGHSELIAKLQREIDLRQTELEKYRPTLASEATQQSMPQMPEQAPQPQMPESQPQPQQMMPEGM